MEQHIHLGFFPVEAVLLIADILDGLAGDGFDRRGRNRFGATGLARLVVQRVSQAARMSQGLMPSLGPSRKNRSTTSSEMRSLTLSGWPSETLSEVNR
jgi:hypothetical protein